MVESDQTLKLLTWIKIVKRIQIKKLKSNEEKLHVQVELKEKNVEVQNYNKGRVEGGEICRKKIQESLQRQKEEGCLCYVLLLFHYMCVECWTWTNKPLCFMDTILLIQYKENSETTTMFQIDYKQIYWYSFVMCHVPLMCLFLLLVCFSSCWFIRFRQLSAFG